MFDPYSAKNITGSQVQDLVTIEEELRARERCAISRLSHCPADPEPHGVGRGELSPFVVAKTY